jgi:hypothetical protein
LTDDAETDLRARHLEALQKLISRLSQNSFTVRGWSLTLVTAAFALVASQALDRRIVLFALLPTVIFWGLDASYLRTERLFRALYDAAVRRLNDPTAPDIAPFDMDTAPFKKAAASWTRLLFSLSVIVVPAIMAGVIVGYAVIRP